MTFTAKVLVVLNLILALIFAGMSSVLYSKRLDMKAQLDDVRAKLEAKNKNLVDENSKLDQDFKRKSEDAAGLQAKLTTTEENLATLKKVNDNDAVLLKEVKQQLTSVTANRDETQAILKSESAKRDQVEEELTNRKKALEDTREKLATARNEITDLSRRLASTEEERNKYAMNLKSTSERLDQVEAALKYLGEKFRYDVAVQMTIAGTLPTLKDIAGKVLTIEPTTGYVVIDKGKDDGVLTGNVFTVYRGDEFVARIMIKHLDTAGKLAAGQVINKYAMRAVKQGDSVATRLFIQ